MDYRHLTGAGAVAAAFWMPIVAQAFDETKYPDLKGEWLRVAVSTGVARVIQYDPSKPAGLAQEAPLTPEYQAILEANIAEHAQGGQGGDPTYLCLSPGMPRVMGAYSPMEIVVTPETTYILIEHIHDSRRIHTDGRDFPPTWRSIRSSRAIRSAAGSMRTATAATTRCWSRPAASKARAPTRRPASRSTRTTDRHHGAHLSRQEPIPTCCTTRSPTIDNALTRPWTVTKNYRRDVTTKPIWWREDVCAENNVHVAIGNEDYFLSADGLLMPAKKDQPPPDLRYFKQTRK